MNSPEVTTVDYENRIVLANGVQLGASIVRKVAGNETSDGFGGEPIGEAQLTDLLAAKINSYLNNPNKGGNTR